MNASFIIRCNIATQSLCCVQSTYTVLIIIVFDQVPQKNIKQDIIFSLSSCEKFTRRSLCSVFFFFFVFCLRLSAKFAQLLSTVSLFVSEMKASADLGFLKVSWDCLWKSFVVFKHPSSSPSFSLLKKPPCGLCSDCSPVDVCVWVSPWISTSDFQWVHTMYNWNMALNVQCVGFSDI